MFSANSPLSLSKRNQIKTEKMCDYMPEEVILKILNRLPVKSLMSFRSVCKSWNTLIFHPSFISTHLQASLSGNTPFLLLRCWKRGQKNYFLHYNNDGLDEFKQLQFPIFGSAPYSLVIGSCNGLICVQLSPYSNRLKFFLWNPSIQKYIFLPPPSISVKKNFNIGFRFDSRTGDYNLLIVGVEEDGSWIKPYLFLLNENSWKRVAAVSPNYTFDPVLGLSLPLPFESSIAVITHPGQGRGEHEVWIMNEYCVVESWTKVFTLTLHIQRKWFPTVMGFKTNGDVLLLVDDGEIASFDLSCQQMKPCRVEFRAGLISICCSYVESLVLLDKVVDDAM
ncbi:hypothetical protein V6N11_079275 [Hibiscus sabdariffa]|uniref:F-box domain-containing protein n=1 Tax=Hibiscus sabdariffa TaxID=183260 RepID=A0ABR2RUW7_9ROSI